MYLIRRKRSSMGITATVRSLIMERHYWLDYPLAGDTISLMKEVRAKTICQDFDEQLDVVERLYGQHIQFSFDRKVAESMLTEEKYYPAESKRRVGMILMDQKRKYRYLFADESSE